MSPTSPQALADELRAWVQDHRSEIARHLISLAEMETPTEAIETFDPFFQALAEDLEAVGLETDRVLDDETGGRLEAWQPGAPGAPDVQLVIGHADTVWPKGTLDEHPVVWDEDTIQGPGTLDMKGGLTQLVFALRALQALDQAPTVPLHVMISSDEEIGSPVSRHRVRELAQRANRVLVLEPASGAEGKVKTARKAVGRFTVHIEGTPAHAGIEPEAGASAIEELAHVIQTLHGLTDTKAGVTVNVGLVEAGMRVNVVAPNAVAEVDVRAPTREAARSIEERILALTPTTSGTRITVEGSMDRPPLEPTPGNRLLFQRVQALARHLDLDVQGASSGGASDGNDASQHAPTIDGFGAVGEGAHEDHEHVLLDRLLDRICLLALTLLEDPLPDDPEAALGG